MSMRAQKQQAGPGCGTDFCRQKKKLWGGGGRKEILFGKHFTVPNEGVTAESPHRLVIAYISNLCPSLYHPVSERPGCMYADHGWSAPAPLCPDPRPQSGEPSPHQSPPTYALIHRPQAGPHAVITPLTKHRITNTIMNSPHCQEIFHCAGCCLETHVIQKGGNLDTLLTFFSSSSASFFFFFRKSWFYISLLPQFCEFPAGFLCHTTV